jgi:hypothetical protein
VLLNHDFVTPLQSLIHRRKINPIQNTLNDQKFV